MSTGIEWCEEVWNPVVGCSKVSAGCKHCYAERMAKRLVAMGQEKYQGTVDAKGHWTGKVNLVPEALEKPLRWKRPRVIFVNSMSDLFHDAVPDGFIDRVFAVMALASQHTFIVLTKRAERMERYISKITHLETHLSSGGCWASEMSSYTVDAGWRKKLQITEDNEDGSDHVYEELLKAVGRQFPNVVLGVSIENQAAADERIPLLLRTPAACRVVSAEPLLGPVDLSVLPRPAEFHRSPYGWDAWLARELHGVIVGGESGKGARPMHPDWARGLRDQCVAAGVKFFFKQWGEWAPVKDEDVRYGEFHGDGDWIEYCLCEAGTPGSEMYRIGKRRAGRTLDGRTWDDLPWQANQ